jgi:hypothetical protein
MIQKLIISSILIILLLACFLSPVSAGDENDSVFKEQKDSPDFIATRGTFPDAPRNSEPGDYSSTPLYKCWSNMTETDQLFGEFESYVIGLPYSCSGFMIVELESDKREMITETILDDIYQMLDVYCENEGISDVPVVFMWSHREESISLPDYGPHIFEEAKKEPAFIAARGTMPVITDEGEKREWLDLLGKGIHNCRYVDRYFKSSGGPTIAFGLSINGYLFVEFDIGAPGKVNESLISEIYQVIDDGCKQKGINDVPVVFMWSQGEITLDEAIVAPAPDEGMLTIMDENGNYIDVYPDEVDIDEEGNYVLKDKSTAKQSPGFTLSILVMSIFLLMKSKKT